MQTTREFQDAILRWLKERQGTVVVPTRRLARVLVHRHREAQRSSGNEGWELPRVLTLNQLLAELWRMSWPESLPAGELLRYRIWQELLVDRPPPEGVSASPDVIRLLDASFAALVRDRLDPADDRGGAALVRWRARLARSFAEHLQIRGLFHPAHLAERVAATLGTSRLDYAYLLAGLESPSRTEEHFISSLASQAELSFLSLPRGAPITLRAVAVPHFQQELLWLGEAVMQAVSAGTTLGRVGIVLPDIEEYLHPVRRVLADILGKAHGPGSLYNVALADSLWDHPLVRAARLPLLLALEPDRKLLLELILSTYYAAWQDRRAEMAWADHVWREHDSDGTLHGFFAILEQQQEPLARGLLLAGKTIAQVLSPLQKKGPRPLGQWLAELRGIWAELGFPVLAGERDEAAFKRLQERLGELERELADLPASGPEMLEWLRLSLQEERTGESGDELCGVQVLGLVESRGLSFDWLILPGLTSRNLPQPERPMPLLSTEERRRIRGGTAESRYEFGRASYESTLACAPTVLLSRPQMQKDEILPASLFWPDPLEEKRTLLFWAEPNAAWIRAPWVRKAWEGRGAAEAEPLDDRVPDILPEKIAVTKLGTLFTCPFKFLVQHVLGLEPLLEPELGIPPLERGTFLHEILASIVRGILSRQLDLVRDEAAVAELIREMVSGAVRRRRDRPLWLLEQRRLLEAASEGGQGMLWAWLEQEKEHWATGWRFFTCEVPFHGRLSEEIPFEISGRIDRLDVHPERGLLCWDYKSGHSPPSVEVKETFVSPQLPAYLAAIHAGLIPGVRAELCGAAYWELRSEGELKMGSTFIGIEEEAEVTRRFLLSLAEQGRRIAEGIFAPVSAEEGSFQKACSECGYALYCRSETRGKGE